MTRPLKELVDAIRKNGYEQITGDLFQLEGDQIKACALGQAALNLGYITEQEVWDSAGYPNGIYNKFVEFGKKRGDGFVASLDYYWYEVIYTLNDGRGWTLDQIADYLEEYATQQ